jgi:hypothetical protein
MLEARIGEQQLARAYFRGETDTLRRGIDRQLGSGTFNALTRALQHGDYHRAEALLKYGKLGHLTGTSDRLNVPADAKENACLLTGGRETGRRSHVDVYLCSETPPNG